MFAVRYRSWWRQTYRNLPIRKPEEKTYADMSNSELVSLVVGIRDIIDHLEVSIDEDHENAENLVEAKDFLEDVLLDIKASRQ